MRSEYIIQPAACHHQLHLHAAPAVTCLSLVNRDAEEERQSKLMLQALQAPLADSRAAAVIIRLILCISRQAKIGFCLQTPNNFKCALVLAEQQAAVQVKCLKGQERSENARGKKNLGAQTAGAVCRTIPARFQLQEVSVGLESSKLRRRPAGRRQLQEALHNSSPAAAGTLDLGR